MSSSEIRHTDISWIQDQLNNRPRKSLGYLTPAQVAKNELYALEMWIREAWETPEPLQTHEIACVLV